MTMWMPVTEVPDEEEGGTGLTFASRSHRDFALSFWKDPHAAEDLQVGRSQGGREGAGTHTLAGQAGLMYEGAGQR